MTASTRRPSLPEPDLATPERAALKLWVVLARAHAAITDRATAHVAQYGMTLAEFGVLEALYHKGPLLLGEVQRKLLVSSGGVTYLVDRLERRGLVRRDACLEDRRARYAVLTDEGTSFVARVFPEHSAAIREATAGLDLEEQLVATRLLKKLGLAASSAAGSGEEHADT